MTDHLTGRASRPSTSACSCRPSASLFVRVHAATAPGGLLAPLGG
ncbi:hypothetical protein [Streptomyces sp. NBC_00158]